MKAFLNLFRYSICICSYLLSAILAVCVLTPGCTSTQRSFGSRRNPPPSPAQGNNIRPILRTTDSKVRITKGSVAVIEPQIAKDPRPSEAVEATAIIGATIATAMAASVVPPPPPPTATAPVTTDKRPTTHLDERLPKILRVSPAGAPGYIGDAIGFIAAHLQLSLSDFAGLLKMVKSLGIALACWINRQFLVKVREYCLALLYALAALLDTKPAIQRG